MAQVAPVDPGCSAACFALKKIDQRRLYSSEVPEGLRRHHEALLHTGHRHGGEDESMSA
jgi:hypothetical protein